MRVGDHSLLVAQVGISGSTHLGHHVILAGQSGVAGHLHIAPTNRDFKSEINLYEKQVLVVHNADMNGDSIFNEADMKSTKHDIICTNSLFLYPDRVVVKTYDHEQGGWLGQLERVIIPPKP